MNFFRSRMDRFRDRVVERAEKGEMGMSFLLFKSEMKKVVRMGFEVHEVAIDNNGERLCSIHWDEAFNGKALTPEQSFYAYGTTDELPKTENFAQTLYLMAIRKNS